MLTVYAVNYIHKKAPSWIFERVQNPSFLVKKECQVFISSSLGSRKLTEIQLTKEYFIQPAYKVYRLVFDFRREVRFWVMKIGNKDIAEPYISILLPLVNFL